MPINVTPIVTVAPEIAHNYYVGRAESDITEWVHCFIEGMMYSFEKVLSQILISSEK